MAAWLPAVTRILDTLDAGALSGVATKGILHTTEGGSIESNVSGFRGNNFWPHLIVDPSTETLVQCLAFDRAARALPLHNADAGVQIEIVSRAAGAPTWSESEMFYLWKVMREVEIHTAIPRQSYIQFDSSGQNRFRMTLADFQRFQGWCGHQHAPDGGDHWDPGGIRNWNLVTPRLGGTVNACTSARALTTIASRDETLVALFSGIAALNSTQWTRSSASWGPAAAVPGVVTSPGSPIAATARQPDILDVFFVGADGRLYTTWRTTGGWASTPLQIGGGVMPHVPGGIAAVARTPYNLDVFFSDATGAVLTAYWNPIAGWNGSWRINHGVNAGLLPCITAVTRQPGILEVFFIGADGHLWTTRWREAGTPGWSPTPSRVGGDANPPTVNAAGGVAAVARTPHNLDLFFSDTTGAVLTTYWNPTSRWANGSWRINHGVNAGPIPCITALARQPDILDVFFIGADGLLYTTWWANGAWTANPIPIGGPVLLDPTQGISASCTRPNQLDLLVHSTSHLALTWHEGQPWPAAFSPQAF
jgi:hypothetical protein